MKYKYDERKEYIKLRTEIIRIFEKHGFNDYGKANLILELCRIQRYKED
jgi:hypothetical protein